MTTMRNNFAKGVVMATYTVERIIRRLTPPPRKPFTPIPSGKIKANPMIDGGYNLYVWRGRYVGWVHKGCVKSEAEVQSAMDNLARPSIERDPDKPSEAK